jgi:gelsolin
MSGLVKPKQYDFKDSNLALFGSDLEKNVKKASAETEVAWKGAGQKLGLEIWRINNFQVERWPKQDTGKFFDGDSYIILNTYKKPDETDLEYDLHFWIGKASTQDEYGTAAYKTVELDTLLNDKPVQHREVMGYESDLFKSYFHQIVTMNGGVASGFRHVEKKVAEPRLFKFHGDRRGVTITQVSLNKANLDSSDVFILDVGDYIYQWNGATCNKDEKFRATQYCQELKSEKGKATVEVLDDPCDDPDFFKHLKDDGDVIDRGVFQDKSDHVDVLMKLSDASGSLQMTKIAEGAEVTKDKFKSDDVFILDRKNHLYVWIGSGASKEERKNWAMYAHNYLASTDNPVKPVSTIMEGKEPEYVKKFFQ